MNIRPAEKRDAGAIAAIWNRNIRDTANTFTTAEKTRDGLAHDLEQRHAEGKVFLVAEDGGQIMGFATYFQFRGGPGYAHTAEHTVMVDEAANGQGVGRALMIALEDHARQAGMHSLIAGVSGENRAGAEFPPCAGLSPDCGTARGGVQIRALDGFDLVAKTSLITR